MNHNMKRTAKGFTLIELIIVIAIIGILLGILMPSMMNYYRRSRIQAANADAKMVYNAAQTAAQRLISQDRMRADADKSGFAGTANVMSINGTGTYSFLENQITTPIQSADVDGDSAHNAAREVFTTVNRTVSGAEELCWAVRIDNYLVKASVAAENQGTNNFGSYSANRQMETLDSVRNTPFTFSGDVVARLAAIQRDSYDGTPAPSEGE